VSLDGRDVRIVKGLQHLGEPAGLQNDVLIDLTDDRMNGFADAGIDRGRGPAALAVDQP
jgi:hypothetical protein